jgi:hypothetical protein
MANTVDTKIFQGKWVHSHEEDTADEMVFRPATHSFPPSRGRRSFELRSDGSMIDHRIGPDDRPSSRSGSWDVRDTNELELRPTDPMARSTTFQVLQADPDKLVLKK